MEELILVPGDTLSLAYIIAWLCRFVELAFADSMSYRNQQAMPNKLVHALKLSRQCHHTLDVIANLLVTSNFVASAGFSDILVKGIISHQIK